MLTSLKAPGPKLTRCYSRNIYKQKFPLWRKKCVSSQEQKNKICTSPSKKKKKKILSLA